MAISNEARRLKAAAEFVSKAKSIHEDSYDYSLVEYKTNKIKVKIICKHHGEFLQTPGDHINSKHGCPVCSAIKGGKDKTIRAIISFEAKANIIHNYKYDYSLVEYTNSKTKVKIICPIHGIFLQQPNNHISGKKGCPHCALSEQGWTRTHFKAKCDKNNNGLGILYILECFNDNERFFKIGITSRSVKERYPSKESMPYLYSVVKEIVGDPIEIYNLETKLHQINKENQYIPNVSFKGSITECFSEYKEK